MEIRPGNEFTLSGSRCRITWVGRTNMRYVALAQGSRPVAYYKTTIQAFQSFIDSGLVLPFLDHTWSLPLRASVTVAGVLIDVSVKDGALIISADFDESESFFGDVTPVELRMSGDTVWQTGRE
jgi:hypothetical protein